MEKALHPTLQLLAETLSKCLREIHYHTSLYVITSRWVIVIVDIVTEDTYEKPRNLPQPGV